MEAQAVKMPDDPFLGQAGRCPHCGVPFPAGAEVEAWSYGYAIDLGGGRAGVQGGPVFRSACGQCHAPLWVPGADCDCREWTECDPAAVVWHRDRCAHLIFGK